MSLLLAACASDPDPRDAGGRDAEVTDAQPTDAQATDAQSADAAATDGGITPGPYGFTMRMPRHHDIPCTGMFCPSPTIGAEDVDYVCDLRFGTLNHYVYVQARPMSFLDFMGFLYEVDAAYLSDGTTVTQVSATYSWGGGHHNDSLTVDVGTYVVRYDHSSFGFGFRQCQPMDCLVIYEPGPGAEVQNGCRRDRSVPAICKPVAADGTVPPLVDTFMRCPGDT